MNDPAVIAWLESPEGEQWSRRAHCRQQDAVYRVALISVKEDRYSDYGYSNCEPPSFRYAAILFPVLPPLT
jgi:hypothetical protein